MDAITWTNERRKLRDLIDWERNPRGISKAEAARLERSLDEFGQVEATEMRKHLRHRLSGLTLGGQRAQFDLRMARKKSHEFGARITAGAQYRDPKTVAGHGLVSLLRPQSNIKAGSGQGRNRLRRSSGQGRKACGHLVAAIRRPAVRRGCAPSPRGRGSARSMP